MRVIIAAASFPSNISGVQQNAINMTRCLLQHPEISAVHLVISPWQRSLAEAVGINSDPRLLTHVAEMDRGALSRNLWYYRRLPELAAYLQADVVHATYPVPLNADSFSCPTVATLNDLYPYEIPGNFGFPKVIVNRLVLQQCLGNADSIVCVSDATRHLLRKYAPIAAWNKSIRIYNCVEPPVPRAIQSPIPNWDGEPYLLCVAQHRRNKNIPLLIQTFSRLLHDGKLDPRMKLLVVGIGGPDSPRIHRMVARNGLSQRVHLLEGLPEPQLQWCYARCDALIAPSITEGFGLPIVEGLIAGCKVVCSDIPAFREVGGNDCRFVSLTESARETLADAIVAAIREPAQAPRSFPHFSASALAEQYVGLYRRLIASASRTQSSRYSTSLRATASERRPL
jgi:glycosyltransferase involved in cell wall biosynthesis